MLSRQLPRLSSTLARSTVRPLRSSIALRNSTTTAHSNDPEHKGTSGGPHGDHYDPPGGWLWGIRPGEKYEKEGWEGIFYYGFVGSLVVALVAYSMKEDTSIQTWALEEARRRLEKEGFFEDSSK